MKRLIAWVRRIKLSRRIMGFSILISVGPLLLLGALSYQIASGATIRKIAQSTESSLTMARMNLENTVERLEGYSVEIAFSRSVQKALEEYHALGEYQRFVLEQQMQQEISNLFAVSNFISDVLLVTGDFDAISAYQRRAGNLRLSREYLGTLAQRVKKAGDRSVFAVLESDQALYLGGGVAMARMVNNIDTGERIGYILICFDESYLRRICQVTAVGEGGLSLIVDQTNTVVSSNTEKPHSGESFFDLSMTTAMFTGGQDLLPENITLGDERYLMSCEELLPGRWFMVNLIPYGYLMRENSFFLFAVSLTVALCVGLSLGVATLISHSVNEPLKGLLGLIGKVNQGVLEPEPAETGPQDEISTVTASFNQMLTLLRKLMEDVRRMEQQRHALEFQALMAQINPHFLSNTLGNIKWLAEMQGADNIAQLSDALVRMMADVMVDSPTTTMEKEIEFLRQYVLIQQYRYLDKFTMTYAIEEETKRCIVPRFILQPLVENAIIHGISPKKGGGHIVVACRMALGRLCLLVEDNGVGMGAETWQRLLTEAGAEPRDPSRFGSIGLNNTIRRFRLRYGEEGMFRFETPEGGGTRVVLEFPAQREEEP